MSMKRFLGRGKDSDKESSSNNQDNSSIASGSTSGSRESISEMPPIFEDSTRSESTSQGRLNNFKFTNDPKLNLNPSISNKKPGSVLTKDSEYGGKSIFSKSRKTFSTKQSSYFSSSGSGKPETYTYNQPLQILNIAGDSENQKTPVQAITDKLQSLYDDLAYILNQFHNSFFNLTTAVINSIDCFKSFVAFAESLPRDDWNFTTYNNSNLRKIMKIYLNFYDNMLKDEVYVKLKLLLVKNFNDFAQTLNSNNSNTVPHTIVKPQNFAIGINGDGASLPNEDVLARIIDKISKTYVSIKEQNGSFIAPIARGISTDLNILCLYFGYPNPTDYHTKLTQSLHGLYDDIHIVVMKNRIDLASLKPQVPPSYPEPFESTSKIPGSNEPESSYTPPLIPPHKFKLPFRIPTDLERPPMSLSLSIENSTRTSGTMGGYIYPIIDVEKQPRLESYANSKFAISCGHVCLDSSPGGTTSTEYPLVSAPSSVLIYLYKQALMAQYQKASEGPDLSESKAAYGSVLNQVEQMFPLKRVKVVDPKTKQESYELRNLPKLRFGQIIWGERNLVNTKSKGEEADIEKKLSDLAIIKVNKNLVCDQNFLGDDIPFNEFDPALMFDNLYVRKVINLKRHSTRTNMNLNVDEVDSDISNEDESSTKAFDGLPVFKYGSTTKFTKGNLNGIKLVYWLDGAIHSSEFIVNSVETNSAFAAGGDSGSWILSKLEDIDPKDKGLGVVGMLHSYDGEFKQFGLYTPMTEILARLKEVTGITWGVVGVTPEKGVETGTGTDESSTDYDSESGADSDSEGSDQESDGAYPPEVD